MDVDVDGRVPGPRNRRPRQPQQRERHPRRDVAVRLPAGRRGDLVGRGQRRDGDRERAAALLGSRGDHASRDDDGDDEQPALHASHRKLRGCESTSRPTPMRWAPRRRPHAERCARPTSSPARGHARVIAATGNSQLGFLRHLVGEHGASTGRGSSCSTSTSTSACRRSSGQLPPRAARAPRRSRPASRRSTPSTATAIVDARPPHVGAAIARAPIDVAFVGIGENGHLAFNDPPADFETTEPYLVVTLDEACRRQQVGEGWFATIDDVPTPRDLDVGAPDPGGARDPGDRPGRAQGRGGAGGADRTDHAGRAGVDPAHAREHHALPRRASASLVDPTPCRAFRPADRDHARRRTPSPALSGLRTSASTATTASSGTTLATTRIGANE